MTSGKPYLDYTFPGVTTFTELLDKTLTSYRIYTHESTREIFSRVPEILNEENDSLSLGSCSRDNKTVFFAEFSLGISEGITSNIVFIYDHFPSLEELVITARDLEALTVQALKEKHGDSIGDLEKLDEIDDPSEAPDNPKKLN